MKKILISLFLICVLMHVQAQTYQEAEVAFQKAEYEQAELLFDKISKNLPPLSDTKLACDLQRVRCILRQGRLAEAMEAIEAIQTTANTPQEALYACMLGEIQLNQGRNDLALKTFETVTQKASQYKMPLLEAQGYAYTGLVYWNTGNQELAYEYQSKALHIRTSEATIQLSEVAASYNDLGLIYSTSDPIQARQYYEKALNIYQKVYTEKHPKIAISYINIAITYKAEKKYVEALEQLEKATKIWEDVYGMQHPNTAFGYTNIGQTQAEMGNTIMAETYLGQARQIYEKKYGNKHPEVANIYNLLGNLYRGQSRLDEALTQYQNAMKANTFNFDSDDVYTNPNLEQIYNPDILLTSLVMKAELLEEIHFAQSVRMKDLKMALYTLELCDKLLDKIRMARQSKNDKIALGQTASQVYEYAIRVCLQLREVNFNKRYYAEKAFYFAEKSKSAVLLSAIADTEAKEYVGIPTEIIAQETHLKNNITRFEQKIAQNPNDSKAYQDSLFVYKRDYEAFIKKLENDYTSYYELKYNTKVASYASLKEYLADDEAILLYFIAEKNKRIYLFQITNKNLDIWDIPKHENLDKQINALRNGIKFRSAKVYTQSAYFLYQNLGLSRIAKKYTHLIIIPDGRLGTVPFEALLTTETSSATSYQHMAYWSKTKNIGYAFSTTLLLQNTKVEKAKLSESVLLCAPVDFSIHKQATLKGSEIEVLRLKEFFQEKQYKVVCQLRAKADKTVFKDLPPLRILHLATHGEVNEETPEFSQILLAGKSKDEANLYSSDIYNLRIPAELVTLSACETGLGKVYRGEGIIGLTRALFYAGAKNVVVSLWTVSDSSTSELMYKFYEQIIQNNKNYREALRASKLALQATEEYAAPYYWAAFILVGE